MGFLKNVFGQRGKKWLFAVEGLINDYYKQRININISKHNGKDDDSEATMSLSPKLQPIADNNEYKLADDVIVYDKSEFDHQPFIYKFGFKDILVRDLINGGMGENEEDGFKESTRLNDEEYARFKDGLTHLADLNIFSYHLWNLSNDEQYKNNEKVKKLLIRFDDDLIEFNESIAEFRNILNVKKNENESIRPKPQSYQNRKIMNGNGMNINKTPLLKIKDQQIVVNPAFNSDLMPKMFSNVSINNSEPNSVPFIVSSIPMTSPAQIASNDSMINNVIQQNAEINGEELWTPKSSKKKKKRSKKKKNSKYDKLEKRVDREFKHERFDEQLCLNPSAYLMGDGFVVKGYSQVLKPFNCSDNLSLNHQVTSIESVKNDKYGALCEVRGIDRLTAKPFLYYSKFCVVSVPLGIMKMSLKQKEKDQYDNGGGITFKPSLSKEKEDAIKAMGMGCENKVYLRFTHCFWPRDKPYFQSIQHPEYRFINFSYTQFELAPNSNVLCTMIPPNIGKKWYSENPAQQLRVIWDVCRVLLEMFKERIEIIHNVGVRRKPSFQRFDQEKNEKKAEDVTSNENVAKNGDDDRKNDVNLNGNIQKMEQDDLNEVMEEMKIDSDGQRYAKLASNENDGIAQIMRMLVDYKVTDWEHNIFSRGSYSYLSKGAIYSHCKALQKYDGNGIYFCGEATSVEGFECVDGAHETGFNVAKEIHKQLQKLQGNY